MAYRARLPNVFHGISLQIKAGEMIHLVEQTGAGKSSLTLWLLRIVEYSGKIVVDGSVEPLPFAIIADQLRVLILGESG
ncbi:hypothetical protein FB451DRAFT_1305483 [Mycena latifolia]|nr:hypothetical protein FB451DRAFT_1305483 [Mycena latifolia]